MPKTINAGLLEACQTGDLEIAKLLLSLIGSDVNCHGVNAVTPLQVAIQHGHEDLIEFLLTQGADLEAEDFNGRTALHYAAVEKNLAVLDLLLKKGANICATDSNDAYPLHHAVGAGQQDHAFVLCEAGNSKYRDAQDNFGYTPLHYAVVNDDVEMVKLLLNWDLNTYLVDNDGMCARDHALSDDVFNLLEESMQLQKGIYGPKEVEPEPESESDSESSSSDTSSESDSSSDTSSESDSSDSSSDSESESEDDEEPKQNKTSFKVTIEIEGNREKITKIIKLLKEFEKSC